MFGMILVDMNGGLHPIWPIRHSDWNGLTSADQIFPNFLFIMGQAIPLALNKSKKAEKGDFFKILKRSILLIIIGMALNF